MRRLRRIGICLLLLLYLAGGTLISFGTVTPLGPFVQNPQLTYQKTPTLFVHGYGGSILSFGPMLSRLQYDNAGQKSMVIYVTKTGELKVIGHLKNRENPLIQLIFLDPFADEVEQSQWIANALRYLYRHGVMKLNLVGHSMGGVSLLRALTISQIETQSYPDIKKIVTISSPFNDLELGEDEENVFSTPLLKNGPAMQMPIYRRFRLTIKRLDPQIKWLNIAGDLEDGTKSDGSVSYNSAFALRSLLKQHLAYYHEELVSGWQGSHYLLHENPAVDKQIIDFLWGTGDKKG
ncbi:alpha/beta hydrolase [Enterococcus hirae]|nr:alpha/beta hydrolase [Enterococcus hirae]